MADVADPSGHDGRYEGHDATPLFYRVAAAPFVCDKAGVLHVQEVGEKRDGSLFSIDIDNMMSF